MIVHSEQLGIPPDDYKNNDPDLTKIVKKTYKANYTPPPAQRYMIKRMIPKMKVVKVLYSNSIFAFLSFFQL